MPDSVLFRVQRVKVAVPDEDLPGPTRYKATCSRCGQIVRDRREVIKDGISLCKPCTDDVYFTDAHEITWPDMNWVPERNHSTSFDGEQNENRRPSAEDHCSPEKELNS